MLKRKREKIEEDRLERFVKHKTNIMALENISVPKFITIFLEEKHSNSIKSKSKILTTQSCPKFVTKESSLLSRLLTQETTKNDSIDKNIRLVK